MNRDRKYCAIIHCIMENSADQAAAIFAFCAAVVDCYAPADDYGATADYCHETVVDYRAAAAYYRETAVDYGVAAGNDGGAEYHPLI